MTENSGQPDDATAESSAGTSDLETLLNEFKERTPPKQEKPEEDELRQFVRHEMLERQQKRVDDDIQSAAASLKKHEELGKLSDKRLKGLMSAYADEDPNFVKAFENRVEDPKAWESALEGGAKFAIEFLSELRGEGTSIRSDLEAAAAAVDGTTHEAPAEGKKTAKELMAMSESDFRAHLDAKIAENEGAR